MKKEKEIHAIVSEYFQSLGWPRNSISFEYRIDPQQIADAILMESSSTHPQVVVEVKSKLNVSELRDQARLRFNPSVRQLQKYASLVSADYYVLTDGEVYLWLETDSTGRPRVLDNPIRPLHTPISNQQYKPSRDDIVRLFRVLQEHFETQSNWTVQDSKIALILLAHFSDIFLHDEGPKQVLRADQEFAVQKQSFADGFGIPLNDLSNVGGITTAFEILDQLPLQHAVVDDILLAIDDVFLQRIRSLYSISRWLADALVTLAEIDTDSFVADVAANVGNILAATRLTEPKAHLAGFARNVRNANWAKVQQSVLGNFNADIRATDILQSKSSAFAGELATHVITAPLMGERIKSVSSDSRLFQEGVRQLEDLLLEAAINSVRPGGKIVFLVPEGLLFGGGNRSKIRKLLLNEATLLAIIGLENGALKPFSGIRTSILIIENRSPAPQHEVFMSIVSNIDDIPYPNSIMSSDKIPELADTLRDYKGWRNNNTFDVTTKSWSIPQAELESDNLSVSRYQPRSKEAEFSESQGKLVKLSEVCTLIMRGRSIRLTDGSIPLIGPATIRPMRLAVENLGFTSDDQISAQALQVNLNDVVVNNIGTHLGAAAVVTAEFAEHFISQHILIFRPDVKLIDPFYLAIALNSANVQEQIRNRSTGSVMPSLTLKRANDLTIPLPSLEVQHEIADSISAAQRAVISAEQNLDSAKQLFDSLLSNLGTQRKAQ